MNTSVTSTDSARLPDYPFVSPDAPKPVAIEPLTTKRERMESGIVSRFGVEERYIPRIVRSAPIVQRHKHRVAPYAHEIIFHTPPNTPNSPRPVEFEKSSSIYCKTDQECFTVPVESEYYDTSKKETFFEQCFVVEKKLGEGSFGEVFQAKFREDLKVYAVKRAIAPYRSNADRALKLREVKKHEELTPHANLVFFHRAWEEKGKLYILTELCVMSLADYCKYDAPPIHELWDVFYDVIHAANYLHSKNLIHLDIKPENIFLTHDKVCKLGDFGLMFDLKNDHMATVEEGDSKYLAPEVLNNPPTQAADIFSIGMSMLEMATNMELPKTGEHWHALRSKDVPERFLSMLEPEMRRIILSMIDPDPTCRPTTKDLINDPVIYWGYKRRTTITDLGLKVSLISDRFSCVSSWAGILWKIITTPIHKIGDLLSTDKSKRKRRRVKVEEAKTPEMKRLRLFPTNSPCDGDDLSFSDDGEDSRRKMTARSLIEKFHADGSPVLRPSLSPFKEYDERRARLEKRRLRAQRELSPMNFRSPASPLYVHAGGAASAPIMGYRPQRVFARGIEERSYAPVSRLRLDSDSDGDEDEDEKEEEKKKRQRKLKKEEKAASAREEAMQAEEEKEIAALVQAARTPLSTSISVNGSELPRSCLRTMHTTKARKLDFSILDDAEENVEVEKKGEALPVCSTPPSALQQRLRMAGGDADVHYRKLHLPRVSPIDM